MQNNLIFEGLKRLSLEDISPKWSKRLKKLPDPISFIWLKWCIEILRASKCIVGEAYGFSSSYTYDCHDCGKIAEMFTFYFILRSCNKLEENKLLFVKHWNENHRGPLAKNK